MQLIIGDSDGTEMSDTLKILVADDHPDLVNGMRLLLQSRGYIVETASDGVAAVELAASFQPDVVLLDISMPRLNGYGAAGQIRSLLGPQVLLVAVTAGAVGTNEQIFKAASFDYLFTKPPDFPRLFRLLRERARRKLSHPKK